MSLLVVGDVIELKEGHKVFTKVPVHFLYEIKKGCWDLECASISLGSPFEYLQGKYIVTKTGVGNVDAALSCLIPNEEYATCESLCGKFKVGFYQSGNFAANKDIEPIGKAELVWQFVDSE